MKRLQHSLDVPGEDMHTCETAGHFFLYQILARWEKFLSVVKPENEKVKKSLDLSLFHYVGNNIVSFNIEMINRLCQLM